MIRCLTVAVLGILLATGDAHAAERTAVLDVQNVTCELCPPIVKRSLVRVPGVRTVEVSEGEGGTVATVTFDDTLTDVPALVTATTNAGFPSQPQAR